jgi:hypothetical protein
MSLAHRQLAEAGSIPVPFSRSVPLDTVEVLNMARRGTLEQRVDHFMQLRGVTGKREQIRESFLMNEALEDAADVLSRRGVDALYQHSGGGIMTVEIPDAPRNVTWIWGFADNCLGFGLDILAPWESTGFGESYEDLPIGITAEQIADKIQERMKQAIPPSSELE